MTGLQILIFIFIVTVVPAVVGSLFDGADKIGKNPVFAWVSGQILLWSGFLVIGIPLVLLKGSFSLMCILFNVYTGVLLAVAVVTMLIRRKRSGNNECKTTVSTKQKPDKKQTTDKTQLLLWAVAGILLVFQLVMTVAMAYEEGDDAFYVGTTTATVVSDTMYQIVPYSGYFTELDARHGLAPFPVWVAYLAKMSGMASATVAQIALPLSLVLMAYGVYYLMASHLFEKSRKNIPFFMILAELLVLFGGYSVFSAENFLLVRASQGKAVIANIIIPFLMYLLMGMLEKMQNQEKIGRKRWVLAALTLAAGCLCSTLGTILTCMLLGVVGLCGMISYRRWREIFGMAACGVLPVCVALLYLLIR